MKKFIALALAATGCALATGAAHAHGNVYWSVGINVPPVGTVISNGPVYLEPAPVYVPAPVYAPVPVVVAPPPVYVVPRRVWYRPVPVYAPRPVVMRPGGYGWGHRHGEWRDARWYDQRRWRHD